MAQQLCPTRSRVRQGRGFSILELVMITTIIAVVAAITLPRLQNAAATSRLAMAERMIIADIQRIVDDALANDYTFEMQFKDNDDEIKIKYDGNAAPDVVLYLAEEPYRVDLVAADADGAGDDKRDFDPRIDQFPGVTTFTIAAGPSAWVVASSNQTSPTTAERSRLLGDRSPAAMDPSAAGGSVAGDGR